MNSYVDASIIAGDETGLIVGEGRYTDITKVYSEGIVEGGTYTGGIAGILSSTANTHALKNSYSNAIVRGDGRYIAGLVGRNTLNTIESSYFAGESVFGYGSDNGDGDFIGGIVGHNATGNISKAYNFGHISGEGIDSPSNGIGGIIGWNNSAGIITKCINFGTVIGDSMVGGIFGDCHDTPNVSQLLNIGSIQGRDGSTSIAGISGRFWRGRMENVFNGGSVEGDNVVGGIIGSFAGDNTHLDVALSYGQIIGDEDDLGRMGGIFGYGHSAPPSNSGDSTTLLYDTENFPYDTEPYDNRYGIAMTTTQLMDPATYISSWGVADDDTVWELVDGQYPSFQFEPISYSRPSTPVADKTTNKYYQDIAVALTTDGATYYTLDGTDPDKNSTLYSGSISLNGVDNGDITLKAITYSSVNIQILDLENKVIGSRSDDSVSSGLLEEIYTFVKASYDTVYNNVITDLSSVDLTLGGLDQISAITQDINLPTADGANGSTIYWTSSDETYISVSGVVTRPSYDDGDQTITLTAFAQIDGLVESKTYDLVVTKLDQTDTSKVNEVLDGLLTTFSGADNITSITGDVAMPASGSHSSSIVWTSSDEGIIGIDGSVSRPAIGASDEQITLNAEVTVNGTTISRDYILTVKAQAAPVVVDPEPQERLSDQDKVEDVAQNIKLTTSSGDSLSEITSNLSLPTSGAYNSTITWASSDSSLVTSSGNITRPSFSEGDQKVVLTAEVELDGVIETKTYIITVKALEATAQEVIQIDKANLGITLSSGESLSEVKGEIELPSQGENGSTISWISSNPDLVSSSGQVRRPATGQGDQSVTLTAIISKDGQVEEKTFDLIVSALNDKVADITGEDGQIDEEKVQEAIDQVLEAAAQASDADVDKVERVVLKVTQDVIEDKKVEVEVGIDQVQALKEAELSIVVETNNVSVEVPMTEAFMTLVKEAIEGEDEISKSLVIVCEQIDMDAKENEKMFEEVGGDKPLQVLERHVYDFSMKVIEKNSKDEVIKEELLENYSGQDEIALKIEVGHDKFQEDVCMVFYYNEGTQEWELVESIYDQSQGQVKISTRHLSIYSVMYVEENEAVRFLVDNVLNKIEPKPSLLEILNMIEASKSVLDLSDYNQFTSQEKEEVAQILIDSRPIGGYTTATFVERFGEIVEAYIIEKETGLLSKVQVGQEYTSQIINEIALYEDNEVVEVGTHVSAIYLISGLGDERDTVAIELSYDQDLVANEDNLILFIYNKSLGQWQALGGLINKELKTISVELPLDTAFVIVERASEFVDMKGHWGEEAAHALASRMIFGYECGQEFMPDMGITRAEITMVLTRILGLTVEEQGSDFDDVDGINKYSSYIALAREHGIVFGVSDSEFQPDRIVSREELIAMVMRVYKSSESKDLDVSLVQTFSDENVISEWAKKDIYEAKCIGLIEGYDNNDVDPRKETSRIEAAMVFYRFLEKLGKL